MSAVNRVDATAMAVLTDLQRDLVERHIQLHLAEVKGPVQDRMQGTRLLAGLAGRDEMLRRILWRTYGLALLVIAATAWSLT